MSAASEVAEREAAPRPGHMIQVWGRRVHYHRQGNGIPIILLHGNGSMGEEILRALETYDGVSWIAPDRPGYGQSEALPAEQTTPAGLADWVVAFADALGVGRLTVVAHSLSCGTALCLAARHPDRTSALVLLAPFVRPTPERWMLGLRLAVTPVVGQLLRRVILPMILPALRPAILATMTTPHPVPDSLADFPVSRAANPQAVLTMATELRGFNVAMRRELTDRVLTLPVVAVLGRRDKTALPHWHLPWLRRHVARLQVVTVPDAGHVLHHQSPGTVMQALAAILNRPGTTPQTPPDLRSGTFDVTLSMQEDGIVPHGG